MALKIVALSLIILGASGPTCASGERRSHCGTTIALSQRLGRIQKVTTVTSHSGNTLTLALDHMGRIFRIWDTRKQRGRGKQYRTFISPFEVSLPTRQKIRSITTVEAPWFLKGKIPSIVGLVTSKKVFLLMPNGQLVPLPATVLEKEQLTDITLSLEGEFLTVYVSSNHRVFSNAIRLVGRYSCGIDINQPPQLTPFVRALPSLTKLVALSADRIVTVQGNSEELTSVVLRTNQETLEIGRFASVAGIAGHRRHSTDNVYVIGRLTPEQSANRLYLWNNRSHAFKPVPMPWDSFSQGQITAFTSHASKEASYRYQNEATLLQKAYNLRRPGRVFARRELGVFDCVDSKEHCPVFFGLTHDGWVMTDVEMVSENSEELVRDSIALALDELAEVNLGGTVPIMLAALERSENIISSRYNNLLQYWGECRMISDIIRNDETGVRELLSHYLPNRRLQVLFLSLIDDLDEPNILIDAWTRSTPSQRLTFISEHMKAFGGNVRSLLTSPDHPVLDRLTMILGFDATMDCQLALLHYFVENRLNMEMPLMEGLLAFMEHSGQNPLWHDALKTVEGNEYGQ